MMYGFYNIGDKRYNFKILVIINNLWKFYKNEYYNINKYSTRILHFFFIFNVKKTMYQAIIRIIIIILSK